MHVRVTELVVIKPVILILCHYCVQLYTDWVNYFLQKSSSTCRVTDLQTDLADTRILTALIEAVGMLLTYYMSVVQFRPIMGDWSI